MVNGIHVIICLYPRLLSENLNKVKCKREILIHTGSLVFKFVLCADDQQLFNNKPFIHSFSQDIKDSTHIACYWLYFQPIFPAWIHQRRQIHNTSILKNTTTKIVDIIDLPVSIKWIGSTICMSMHPIVRSVYLPNWQRSIPGNSREQLVSPRYRPHINLVTYQHGMNSNYRHEQYNFMELSTDLALLVFVQNRDVFWQRLSKES
jgi:hypothetical protein